MAALVSHTQHHHEEIQDGSCTEANVLSQLIGFEDLVRKLNELGAAVGGRVLRSALMTASLPALRSIQAAAPVGTKAHRTYKGRLVAPGFLKRNIRRKSLLARDKSRAIVLIGPAPRRSMPSSSNAARRVIHRIRSWNARLLRVNNR